MKKFLSLMLVGAMAVSLAACNNNGSAGGSSSLPTIDSIKLGSDYKDIKASLVFHTNRTDLQSTVFPEYVKKFEKLYPGITVKYVGDTNYAQNMTTELTTKNWGDICMIPTTVKKTQLAQLFVPFGKETTIAKTYNYLDNFSYQGTVYGVPSLSNVQGVVYNKAVFQKAGITSLPKTPDDFIADLQLIKDKTSATPLYTNFSAGWTMGAWDAYISGTATGSADFMNNTLVHSKNPFSKPSNGSETGPYYVYKILYDAVNKKLTEADPTTTDWEGSKTKINNGDIGVMVLGSWAVPQMQQAGSHSADIGYMPFPITVNGKQYATAGPDYNYGINKNASKNNQIASMLYVKWLIEDSNFDTDQGGLPTVKTHALPSVLANFKDVTMVTDNPAPKGEEDLLSKINTESELALNSDNNHVMSIVEAAEKGTPTFDSIMNGWNQKWTAAQQEYGALK
ncbi:ABC transporter substrate-binding protein [Ethanoligenens harbinense]|uniref:Extracellular solute-binding protein family 1 n=1 Tax=Ethanoligenens harbinense (strain DSM 18485 / JCM 12961 / CGMCC 1.5033 / YUAN-3) TaxID=663278 RepID=E6U3G9_ETHHY|nr:ABC transporter substrate-binding protein [Ethanoligenens harbinense]ADU26461.1 extracellular solute-binding protein family 1 [Ethanoligenens harbinense YUAN-3]AVQ95590.1 carbohydrate ABC transporter substrate-binding protein [Ethanoligenens harbinense YUAN-3]AYF38254.1 carbohydrate ABC transporter substrate-binding protein [Ethanoligenens harbinense]AYF41000.1 carbohydrate ABC transporter substrate-binding protein [Ethanoligenens harbinense]QCN91830.1 carbohydrate ABC transporter substrate